MIDQLHKNFSYKDLSQCLLLFVDRLCWFNFCMLITEYGDVTDIYNW